MEIIQFQWRGVAKEFDRGNAFLPDGQVSHLGGDYSFIDTISNRSWKVGVHPPTGILTFARALPQKHHVLDFRDLQLQKK